MYSVVTGTLVLFCISLSWAIDVPPGIKLMLPKEHHVWALEGKKVVFKVSDNTTECERLSRRSNVREVSPEMKPEIAVVFKDGEYRVNITWEYILKGKRLPRVFFINLTFYDIQDLHNVAYLSHTCVMLTLVGDRKIKGVSAPVKAKFYYDFLPLLEQMDIGLVATLWSYTKQQGRHCRSVRSVIGNKGSCSSSVQCSADSSFPISKNAHRFRQCVCYQHNFGIPVLQWNFSDTEKIFKINLTNIPPYLSNIEIDIFDTKNSSNSQLMKIDVDLTKDVIRGGLYKESKQYMPGQYNVTVCVKLKLYMKCAEPGETESNYETQITDHCHYHQFYNLLFPNTLTVKAMKKETFEKKDQTIVGIVGGLVLITLVILTVVTFKVRQHYLRKQNRSDRSNPNQTEQSEQLVTSPNINNIELQEMPTEGHTLFETSTNRNTTNIDNSETEFIQNHRDTLNPDIETCKLEMCSRSSNDRQTEALIAYRWDHRVLLLHHRETGNAEHNNRVDHFVQILKDKHGISLEVHAMANLKDVAKSEFIKFQNIVLIVSDRLVQLCQIYNRAKHEQCDLPNGDFRDFTLCVFLQKIGAQMRGNTKRLFLHIVTFECTTDALKRFFNSHPFITNENSFVYEFHDADIEQSITGLVQQLKPIPCQDQIIAINSFCQL